MPVSVSPDPVMAAPPRLSTQELAERIAIVRQLRDALLRQRDQFRAYLAHLERQEAEPAGVRNVHAELRAEQRIAQEILALQRTIEPLEMLYRAAYPESVGEIQQLAESLERVKSHVLQMIELDRGTLREEVRVLREQVRKLRAAL